MFDTEGVMAAIMQDHNNVKTSIVVVKLRILTTIYLGDSANVDLFSEVHVGDGAVHRVIGSCFYFNKY